MMKKDCDNCLYSGRPSYKYPCCDCQPSYGSPPTKWEAIADQKTMTNADRIRAMSDEELAEYLVYHNPYHTESNCLKWLKQPAR